MDEVRKGIQRLFKKSTVGTSVKDIHSIIKNMETHQPNAWEYLGDFTSEKSPSSLDFPAYDERLPTYLKQISGYIVKLTPSFVGLIFEVSLHKQYNTNQLQIQSNLLLPRVKIIKINFVQRLIDFSLYSSTNAKMEEMIMFRRKVEIETQTFLQKYFSGFFPD